MRVLMVNHPGAPAYRGGDLVQMRKTAEALRGLGVDVEESFSPEPDAHGFDLAHLFNLRTVPVVATQVASLKRSGVPIVLSPIYPDFTTAIWGTESIRQVFSTPREEAEVDRLLDEVRSRRLKIRLPSGSQITAGGPNRPSRDYDRIQSQVLADVDHLLPNSCLEMQMLVRALHPRIPFTIVPCGVDARLFLNPDPEPFVRRYGVRDFVLQVARIEPSKNQVMLCRAMRGLGVPLVLIGGRLIKGYEEVCRRVGPEDLLMIDHMPQEDLASAYAAARVHVLPSWVETCGLASLEAALADCSVVASTAGHELDYLRDLADYCDPGDPGSIRAAVLQAVERHGRDASRRRELGELILRDYTWDRAGSLTLRAYERTLQDRSH